MTVREKPGTELPPGAAAARILFVGHLPGARDGDVAQGRYGSDIELVDFAAVTAHLLQDFDPHFVVSPILTASFDILDLATRLWQLRYRGAYRVLIETPMPNPGMVLSEVRGHCPGLDIDLLTADMLRA